MDNQESEDLDDTDNEVFGAFYNDLTPTVTIQISDEASDSLDMIPPVTKGGNDANYNKIHILKRAIAIAKAPATRSYLFFDQVNSRSANHLDGRVSGRPYNAAATVNDRDTLGKTHQCLNIITVASERQANDANKAASILLVGLEQEKARERKKEERTKAVKRGKNYDDKKESKKKKEKIKDKNNPENNIEEKEITWLQLILLKHTAVYPLNLVIQVERTTMSHLSRVPCTQMFK